MNREIKSAAPKLSCRWVFFLWEKKNRPAWKNREQRTDFFFQGRNLFRRQPSVCHDASTHCCESKCGLSYLYFAGVLIVRDNLTSNRLHTPGLKSFKWTKTHTHTHPVEKVFKGDHLQEDTYANHQVKSTQFCVYTHVLHVCKTAQPLSL